MNISKEFIVSLRGREYPLFAGVLDAATKAGLRSLRTTVLQIPSSENGHLAVVMARAEFEDGRVFEDVGDCSPASTSPQLAAASLRLASTRAKGRVLRDSINVGQTLLEELPDLEIEAGQDLPGQSRASGPSLYVAEPCSRRADPGGSAFRRAARRRIAGEGDHQPRSGQEWSWDDGVQQPRVRQAADQGTARREPALLRPAALPVLPEAVHSHRLRAAIQLAFRAGAADTESRRRPALAPPLGSASSASLRWRRNRSGSDERNRGKR
jgi:hypothetical protein